MYVTITSIKLRSIFQFFPLSYYAMQILKQLKPAQCLAHKTRGLWTTHYTMTLWNSEADLKAFASSGAHLEGMKKSKQLAREIRTLTIERNELPDWKWAIANLKQARVISY